MPGASGSSSITDVNRVSAAAPGAEGCRAKAVRRWRRRAAVWLFLVILIGVGHAPLLRRLAGILVVDQTSDGAGTLWLFDPPGAGGLDRSQYDAAARLHDEDPSRKILLVEDDSSRLVLGGVLPSFQAISRKALAARGVGGEAIGVLDAPGNAWEAARRLRTWLEERPGEKALVVCDRFESRYRRFILASVLGPRGAQRVRFRAVPDDRFDEANWWRSRLGVKVFARNLSVLLYVWIHGEDTAIPARWDPDEYEASLRSGGGAAR